MSAVSEVFKKRGIEESEYVVLFGFDESLIKSCVGYLEQIHIFVSTEVDVTPPLLSEPGRIFSLFSSILFTESSSYHLPVFKDDRNVWEFSELIYSTAFKFADGGSSAKTPLTVIGLSQTPSQTDGPTGFSWQGGSGSGEGEQDEKQRSEKGKERERKDQDEVDKGDRDDKKSGGNPPKGPSGDPIARSSKISFGIDSEIFRQVEDPFQTLSVKF
jgi:hypothetical protein